MKQSTEVKFLFHKDKILAQAQEHGDVNKIETWKKAFPNINFSNVINDTDIHWETEFNPTEIAAYVAIMTNTAVARISYSLEEMDSMNITDAEIDQFTLLMNCWIAHLFTYLRM